MAMLWHWSGSATRCATLPSWKFRDVNKHEMRAVAFHGWHRRMGDRALRSAAMFLRRASQVITQTTETLRRECGRFPGRVAPRTLVSVSVSLVAVVGFDDTHCDRARQGSSAARHLNGPAGCSLCTGHMIRIDGISDVERGRMRGLASNLAFLVTGIWRCNGESDSCQANSASARQCQAVPGAIGRANLLVRGLLEEPPGSWKCLNAWPARLPAWYTSVGCKQ